MVGSDFDFHTTCPGVGAADRRENAWNAGVGLWLLSCSLLPGLWCGESASLIRRPL
jgi:hypothetical protein